MKRHLIPFMLIACTLLLASCSSQRAAINDLASLVEKVEKNGENYTLADWDNVIQKCARIENELQKHEYSKEENEEIGTLKGRLAAIVAKDILIFSAKKTESMKEQLGPGINSFLEELLK